MQYPQPGQYRYMVFPPEAPLSLVKKAMDASNTDPLSATEVARLLPWIPARAYFNLLRMKGAYPATGEPTPRSLAIYQESALLWLFLIAYFVLGVVLVIIATLCARAYYIGGIYENCSNGHDTILIILLGLICLTLLVPPMAYFVLDGGVGGKLLVRALIYEMEDAFVKELVQEAEKEK